MRLAMCMLSGEVLKMASEEMLKQDNVACPPSDIQIRGVTAIYFCVLLCPTALSGHVVDAQETIRATVVGAGSYTTSVSGSTITYDPGLLPLSAMQRALGLQ